jgi:2-haloacid dehalogenase
MRPSGHDGAAVATDFTDSMIEPGTNRSPARGEVDIEAVVFDTYGTVVDFYAPMMREFERLAMETGVSCDAGAMAVAWRTAYVFSTAAQAFEESAFRPLREINRQNLQSVLMQYFSAPVGDEDLDVINAVWDRLDPWPDVVAGLQRLKGMAIIAPLSNGNFADMVRLARYGNLPWDIILGASVSGFYKPHPSTYLASVDALGLRPEEVCMVAAHQIDLAFAAGHGLQTAFVRRPAEFGGPVKPRMPEPGRSYIDAAEIHAEGEWTFVADDFLDLADQVGALRA